jgi:undecaprenyl diphosphate synthase
MLQSSPKHIAIILDGNRRWAKKHGKKTVEGHKKGAEVFRELSLYIFDKNVPYLTAFIFSKENWQRTEEEVSYLMRLVLRAVENHLDEFHKHNIKINIIGEREQLSSIVLKAIERTEEKTRNNTGGVLTLCLNYGGKQEVVDACKAALADDTVVAEITTETISKYMYAPEVPCVDLLIRTSGERRTSGFMLWRSDYAEMYFTDVLWPDMTENDIDYALEDYALRSRRFGA